MTLLQKIFLEVKNAIPNGHEAGRKNIKSKVRDITKLSGYPRSNVKTRLILVKADFNFLYFSLR